MIPAAVTGISDVAFGGCPVESIGVASGSTAFKSRGNCVISLSDDMLIVGCKNSVIPSYTKSIYGGAFFYCLGLESLDVPDSVTSIGNMAFDGCINLTSIFIPDSVVDMGDNVFSGWTNAQTVYIQSQSAPIGWDSQWADGCDAVIIWG
jgi:hypothetical protein